MILSLRFDGRELRVVERVKGYDLVPGEAPVPAEVSVETVIKDPSMIRRFFGR